MNAWNSVNKASDRYNPFDRQFQQNNIYRPAQQAVKRYVTPQVQRGVQYVQRQAPQMWNSTVQRATNYQPPQYRNPVLPVPKINLPIQEAYNRQPEILKNGLKYAGMLYSPDSESAKRRAQFGLDMTVRPVANAIRTIDNEIRQQQGRPLAKFEDKNKTQTFGRKALFGGEGSGSMFFPKEMKTVFGQGDQTYQGQTQGLAELLGAKGKVAKGIGLAGAPIMLGLDLVPGGGGKDDLAKAIAKSKDAKTVAGLIKKAGQNVDPNLVKKLVKETDVKKIGGILDGVKKVDLPDDLPTLHNIREQAYRDHDRIKQPLNDLMTNAKRDKAGNYLPSEKKKMQSILDQMNEKLRTVEAVNKKMGEIESAPKNVGKVDDLPIKTEVGDVNEFGDKELTKFIQKDGKDVSYANYTIDKDGDAHIDMIESFDEGQGYATKIINDILSDPKVKKITGVSGDGIPNGFWEKQGATLKKMETGDYLIEIKKPLSQPTAKKVGGSLLEPQPNKLNITQKGKQSLSKATPENLETLPSSPDIISQPSGANQRGFLKNVEESGKTTDPLKGKAVGLKQQTYIKEAQDPIVKNAERFVGKNPDEARKLVFSDAPHDANKTATAISLAKKYEAEKNYDAAVEVIEEADRQLREAGRSISMAQTWGKLSPEGMLRFANREIEKAQKSSGFLDKALKRTAKELSKDEKAFIVAKMNEAKLLEGVDKERVIKEVMELVNDKIPVGASEMFDAYRYQNMLSGPKTQMRNIYQNLLQTWVTRPADLASTATVDWFKSALTGAERTNYIKDVPEYYKNVMNAIPNANAAFAQVWKGDLSQVRPDLRSIRNAKMPKSLTIVTRFMEGADRYFSTLIGAGEYSRLINSGATELAAREGAHKLAENYLMRGGKSLTEDASYAVQALDSLSDLIQKGRGLPVFGKPFSWFAPFVQTPINFAKANIERTPVGLVGGKMTKEKFAKAATGAIVTAYGANLALQGRTTWDAPVDPKEKELFYATGKKPYSIKVGDKWMPMWYFGPFALSVAIPAAAKHFYQDQKNALTDTDAQKIGKIVGSLTKFTASQTPLQGVSGFFRMLEGDVDVSAGNLFGFTMGQVIPAQGLIRYVNNFMDPTYRKAKGFTEAVMKDLPGLSNQLPAITGPEGEEQRRDPLNQFIPYDIGRVNSKYENALQERKQTLQTNALNNSLLNKAKSGEQVDTSKASEETKINLTKLDVKKDGKKRQIGETVIYKSGDKVRTQNIYEYNDDLYYQQMNKSKKSGDLKTWMATGQKKLANLEKLLQQDNLDELDRVKMENRYTTLQQQMSKYQGYGGFKKGKKIGTKRKGGVRIKSKSGKTITYKGGDIKTRNTSSPIKLSTAKPKDPRSVSLKGGKSGRRKTRIRTRRAPV